MYVDGHLPGRYGETHKVSALESLQFSATSVIPDIQRCVTLEPKLAGDLIYILGTTADELGASEYYDLFGYVGCQVPQVHPEHFLIRYRALAKAIGRGLVASCHGIYRGGLGVHLAMKAMAGGLGLSVDLAAVPAEGVQRSDRLLYSESAGRFIVTIDPRNQTAFETALSGMPLACIGRVTDLACLVIRGMGGQTIIDLTVQALKAAWQKPFGDLL
jgi:phosphoribosylformylglycinamidine synthase